MQVFAVREGQIVNRDSFLLDNYGESAAEDVALQFVPQYYGTAAVPREVLVQSDERDEELETLAEHLSGTAGNARGGPPSQARRQAPHPGDERAQRGDGARARAGAGRGQAEQGRLHAGRLYSRSSRSPSSRSG